DARSVTELASCDTIGPLATRDTPAVAHRCALVSSKAWLAARSAKHPYKPGGEASFLAQCRIAWNLTVNTDAWSDHRSGTRRAWRFAASRSSPPQTRCCALAACPQPRFQSGS